jgi:hypothetical protein
LAQADAFTGSGDVSFLEQGVQRDQQVQVNAGQFHRA